MRLFIVGYMGVGKSSLGKKLAIKLQIPFTDLDASIVEKAGKSIVEIFKANGEQTFRQLEAEVVREVSRVGSAVIATGGGAPMHQGNMEFMLRQGLVIWLRMDEGMIVSRLEQKSQERPLVRDKSQEELHRFVKHHLAEREPTYAKAQIHIQAPLKNASAIDALVVTIQRYSR